AHCRMQRRRWPSRVLKNSKILRSRSFYMKTQNTSCKGRMFKKARSPARSRFGGARSSKAKGSEEAEAYKRVR
ncbi:MAG: hypothetical protein ACE1ZE_00280, partial [Candidatus Binatia bacterium]